MPFNANRSLPVLHIGPLKSVLMWKKSMYRWPQICGRNCRLFFWVAVILSVFFSPPSSLVVSETYNDNMLIWAALNQWIFIARLDHISVYHWNCWELLAVKHDLSKENILKLFLLSWLVSPNDLNCKLSFCRYIVVYSHLGKRFLCLWCISKSKTFVFARFKFFIFPKFSTENTNYLRLASSKAFKFQC